MWIAWPKRASGVATDITETPCARSRLPIGLVDNKVCAIARLVRPPLVIRKELRT